MRDVIINLQKSGTRKVQLTLKINLISSKDADEEQERVSNILPFINKYNWGEIKQPPKIADWKTLEKNNPTIALDVLFIKETEVCPAYISKISSHCENK